ncbi:hypothetical protein D210916BOD24_11050 [Alteromonas sp. D210916BOD_24]|uniref:hypothetical protein n=1 Tax=Alteromonas sp. D210916BOD_24 TaxID=3157618 RepID=UPI00399CFE95
MKFCASKFLLKLKKCNGDQFAIATLSEWCALVSVVVLQSYGKAQMARVIGIVESQFSDVLNAAAEINSEHNENTHSEWVYQEVLNFYSWIGCLKGVPDALIEKRWQEWEPEMHHFDSC